MKKSLFISLLCFFHILGFGQTDNFKVVSVQPKQTLYALAREYNVSVADLKTLNAQYAPDFQLKVGDKIKVPATTAKAETPKPAPVAAPSPPKQAVSTSTNSLHTVQKGETLFSIARQYGMTATEVRSLNKLDEKATLKIGQQIKVSGSVKPTNEAATKQVAKTAVAEAKEVIPSDNLYVKKETVAKTTPIKIEAIPEMPKVVSDKFENTFKESVNPNTKRTLRGIAAVADYPELTSSSFVLYNDAEEGDIVKVVNLMSKKVMYLKVVGKTKNVADETILQVSSDTGKLLQANEGRFLVEVTGY